MSAMADTQDWQAEVIDLKRRGLESAEIASSVGKHPATVRKVIARAREDGTLAEEPIAGQVDIDGDIHGEEPAPEDDPEYEPEPESLHDGSRTVIDPLDDFKREAGESVGPMPPMPELDTDPDVEVRLKGTRQLALDFGPNAAPVVEATIVFKSEKRQCGFYGLGDVVSGTFTARVTAAPGREKFDKDSEEFRAEPTAYVATITDLELD